MNKIIKKKWQKALTVKEVRHLINMNTNTIRGFKRTLEMHNRIRQKSQYEPCWTCRSIAVKLKLGLA